MSVKEVMKYQRGVEIRANLSKLTSHREEAGMRSCAKAALWSLIPFIKMENEKTPERRELTAYIKQTKLN